MMMPSTNVAALAFTCPRCTGEARPTSGVQTFARCGGAFTLQAGAHADPSVRPPPPEPETITVRSAEVMTRKMGVVDSEGVREGTLDPVTGYIPIDQLGVRYGQIASVAVWRSRDVVRLVLVLVFVAPLGLLSLYGGVRTHAFFFVVALPFILLTAYGVWRTSVLQRHFVRVVGHDRVLTSRVDSPLWRRRTFHAALLRRAGIVASPVP